jgi:hypothetical protein
VLTTACGSRSPTLLAPPRVHAVAPPALPVGLDLPREVACTLHASAWQGQATEDITKGHHYLRFGPGARPFAEVLRARNVTLTLPVALASAGGFLELDADGVELVGRIEALEMPIYPAKAFVLSECFVPNHERRLVLRSAEPGWVEVEADSIPRLAAARGALAARRPCSDVSLAPVHFDAAATDAAMAVDTPPPPSRPPLWLRAGAVMLSSAPEGPMVARVESFEPPDDTLLIHPVRVLAVAKAETRIAVETFGGTVFGWVPSDRLWKSPRKYVDLTHDSMSLLGRLPPERGEPIVCARDVPLVAETGGERRRVGTVRAGVGMTRAGAVAEFGKVEFQWAGVTPTDGSSFLVREAELSGCKSEWADRSR